jgi:hypothetical protein
MLLGAQHFSCFMAALATAAQWIHLRWWGCSRQAVPAHCHELHWSPASIAACARAFFPLGPPGFMANEVVAASTIGDGGGVDIQLACWSKFLEV